MTFDLTDVQPRGIPVVVEIPHAGLDVPPDVVDQLVVDDDARARDADLYVHELFADAAELGAAVIVARVSRHVVDLNRDEQDTDALAVADRRSPAKLAPRGVIWRETTQGRPVLRAPLTPEQFRARIERYYRPYHRALAELVVRTREQHGRALVIAAHSMPSMGRSGHGDAGVRRADIVPGTQGRSTARGVVIDAVDHHFRSAGLSVRHDEPYRGGATVVRWGRPGEGIDAVQIEVNRALYLREANLERRGAEFDWMRSLCRSLVERCGALPLRTD